MSIDSDKIIVVSYECLYKNYDFLNNFLYDYEIEYYLVTNKSRLNHFKIWWWCFTKGILPIKIFTNNKFKKIDPYSYRNAIIKIKEIENNKFIYFVTDEKDDINSIRDIYGIGVSNFIKFEHNCKKEKKPKFKPFT